MSVRPSEAYAAKLRCDGIVFDEWARCSSKAVPVRLKPSEFMVLNERHLLQEPYDDVEVPFVGNALRNTVDFPLAQVRRDEFHLS